MLTLTRLGGPVFALNPDLIERIEATPDTVVTLIGGNKYLVAETLDEVTALIHAYRASVVAAANQLVVEDAEAAGMRPVRALPPRHGGTHGGGGDVVPLHRQES